MQVRFWGTRGSIAAPGLSTARFGGNTVCVEVRSEDSLAILDCGTGARPLANSLLGQDGPTRAHLLLTHFHWDHIQGFPFFVPAFAPGAEIHVSGPPGLDKGLEEALSGQMQYTYFPVRLADFASHLTFHEVGETDFGADRFRVATQFLNHTCPAVGYRLSAGGATVAYMTDHEPFWPHKPEASLADALAHPGDKRHLQFFAGADLLIHDAQYLAEEYPAKRGWGHSTVEYVVDVAVMAHVKRLALFHHDPPRTDDSVHALLERARERARWRGSALEIVAAAEGLSIEIAENGQSAPMPDQVPARAPGPEPRVALVGAPHDRRTLREALRNEPFRLVEASLDRPMLAVAGGAPDLVLVSPSSAPRPLEVVKMAHRLAQGRPLVVVLELQPAEADLRQIGELATDVLIAPYVLLNLRARVRACLARRESSATGAVQEQPGGRPDSVQLVNRLPWDELDVLLKSATAASYRPGEVIFRQGALPSGVYYIHEGLIRLSVVGAERTDVTVGFAGPGDTLGEISALDDGPRSATAIVVEPVEASYIPNKDFEAALAVAPKVSLSLLRLFARRLRQADERLASRGEKSRPVESV